MERRTTAETVENSPLSNLCNHCSRASREHFRDYQPANPARRASQERQHLHPFDLPLIGQTPIYVSVQIRVEDLGAQSLCYLPGLYSDSYRSTSPALSAAVQTSRRKSMDQEKGDDNVHDKNVEDLYDLYNACNGEMRKGLLDIRKLEELSKEEREFLDVE